MGDRAVQPHPLGDGSVFGAVARAIVVIVVTHYDKVGHKEEKTQEGDEVWSKPHGHELENEEEKGEREREKGERERRRGERKEKGEREKEKGGEKGEGGRERKRGERDERGEIGEDKTGTGRKVGEKYIHLMELIFVLLPTDLPYMYMSFQT